jgi:predicted ribosome quality control (RQC) complex YloA/Tae2 family protein
MVLHRPVTEEPSTSASPGAVTEEQIATPPPGAVTERQIANGPQKAAMRVVAKALQRSVAGLPLPFAYEAASRGRSDADAITKVLRSFASNTLQPILYRLPEEETDFPAAFVSAFPLHAFEAYRLDRAVPLFALMREAHEIVLRKQSHSRLLEAYLRLLAGEERRLMRLHQHLERESREAGESPLLRRKAESLLVHLREIPRGAKQYTCPDPAEPDRILEIDLNPALAVAANAEAYFRRARRLERGEPVRRKRLRAIEQVVTRLSILREKGRDAGSKLAPKGGEWLREALGRFLRRETAAKWETVVADLPEVTKRAGGRAAAARGQRAKPKEQAAGYHPRTYTTKDGWKVLVGRSNAENDYLTHTLAHPEDYWFHAHGCPGSHVVLRREGRKDNPSAKTIEEAAAIAAFFSRARTSRKAPVAYTLKKYVRKPRKAPAGLAVLTREKTIMVEPKVPDLSRIHEWEDEPEES